MMAESLGWLAPAPLWGEGGVGVESSELLQPFLTELMSDQFVTEFLAIMGAQGGASPTDLAGMAPDSGDGTAVTPYRLFQPLSQRYYLVTASLVCRRVGIPDRAVQRSKGERTTFVLRKLAADGSEQAWIPATGAAANPGGPPTGSWTAARAGQLAAGEDQLPMHPAAVAGFAAPCSTAAAFGMCTAGRRTVHYGYIPTSRRDRIVTALTDADAVTKLQQIDSTQQQQVPLGDLVSRVIQPWGFLVGPPPAPGFPDANPDYSSLYILLDLSDWLQKNLPDVYAAVLGGPSPTGSKAANLVAALNGIWVGTRAAPPVQPPPPPPPPAPLPPPPPPQSWVPGPVTFISLPEALKDLVPFANLVNGTGQYSPTLSYDLLDPPVGSPPIGPLPPTWLENSTTPGSLAYLALEALQEANRPLTVPSELSGMITADPAVATAGYAPDTYIIRTVFEHDPCVPVLSGPSRPFQLARAMDGDAPARKIRIALPDISNMRQFQRGVAIEMPPSLRRLLDRVTPALLQGKGLGSDPGVELGMICSFSIQIMWVLSFMVMFMFVISFNIIFWWLAFIKICFPIPVPSQPSNKSPSP